MQCWSRLAVRSWHQSMGLHMHRGPELSHTLVSSRLAFLGRDSHDAVLFRRSVRSALAGVSSVRAVPLRAHASPLARLGLSF
jgi:hypothetical protein